MSRGIRVASRSYKDKEIYPLLESPKRNLALPTLILAQGDLCQTCKLQSFQMIKLSCLRPLNLCGFVLAGIEN